MWLTSLWGIARLGPPRSWRPKRAPARRRVPRPIVRQLEDCTLLSGGLPYPTATDYMQLAADINAANNAGGVNVVTLGANIQLNAADNTTNGANGLPVIRGNGFGGGLYAARGTVTLTGDTVSSNAADAGAGGPGLVSGSAGLGEGGGLYIDPLASVCLDAFTASNVTGNTASTSDPDIAGLFTTC